MSDIRRTDRWQRWEMAPLERRSTPRAHDPAPTAGSEDAQDAAGQHDSDGETEAAPRRRRDDQINLTLFELAKEEATEKGYAAGHERGYAEGYAEGEAKVRAEHAERIETEIADQLAPMARLIGQFEDAAAQLKERIGRDLVGLALAAGRQLADRALDIQPEHILDDIEALMEAHPHLSGSPTLYVATDDLSQVDHHLGAQLVSAGWRLRADSSLSPGDCRIEDDQREIESIDADRWARLLQAVGHQEH